MATMTTANHNGRKISIDEALIMRDGVSVRPDFRWRAFKILCQANF